VGQASVYAPVRSTPGSAPLRVADTSARRHRAALALTLAVFAAAVAARLWNALTPAPGWGYDAWGHVAYVLYLDLFHALPHADQGWSYFHPPLHYLLAWPLARSGNAEVLLRGMSLLA
jgi:hypothetical protein